MAQSLQDKWQRHPPRQLIVFEVYENSAYEIQQELKRNYPSLDLVTLIGSVRDSKKIMQVFARYQPPDCIPCGGPQACALDGGQPV